MTNVQNTRLISYCVYSRAATLAVIAIFFFLAPVATVFYQLSDPKIRTGEIPESAWSLHRTLTPRYERWARARLATTRAAQLSTQNISGTEWPLFGSVFYLWATETLQDEWAKSGRGGVAPREYAKDAIEAATRLVIDPGQANWVKIHWGDKYLKTENVFYRMLVISALTSHARLTGDRRYLPMLSDQVESFSAELDASSSGLLDDYPGECYPGDVLTAIAMIRKADLVLGTDHSAFVNRAGRGFSGAALDPRGLVPYSATASLGEPNSPSRGCGNSYVSIFSPGIWPEQAQKWYDRYTQYFWQETWTCAGFREFPSDLTEREWTFDVDAGPVLKGYGCAACAFGVGAARANGHFEHAYPLTTEMLATSWPLPDGTRLFPRLFSNAADAPYLGEAGILFNLTRMPVAGMPTKTGGAMPWFTLIFLGLQLTAGTFFVVTAIRLVMRWRRNPSAIAVPWPQIQLGVWLVTAGGAVVTYLFGALPIAMLFVLLALLCPRCRIVKAVPKLDPVAEAQS